MPILSQSHRERVGYSHRQARTAFPPHGRVPSVQLFTPTESGVTTGVAAPMSSVTLLPVALSVHTSPLPSTATAVESGGTYPAPPETIVPLLFSVPTPKVRLTISPRAQEWVVRRFIVRSAFIFLSGVSPKSWRYSRRTESNFHSRHQAQPSLPRINLREDGRDGRVRTLMGTFFHANHVGRSALRCWRQYTQYGNKPPSCVLYPASGHARSLAKGDSPNTSMISNTEIR